MSVLLLVKPGFLMNRVDKLIGVKEKFPGKDVYVVCDEYLENTPSRFYLKCTKGSSIRSVLSDLKFSEIVLFGYNRTDVLPLVILQYLISRDVSSIRLYVDGVLARYRPFFGKKSKTILVFPGPVLPLSMGSHQRSFNLLAAMAYSGYYMDVIVTGGKDLPRACRLLESICPNVYTYKNNKRKLKKILLFRREIERFFRKITGLDDKVPELFADRLDNKATYSLQKTLKTVLLSSPDYQNVIVSYAWMKGCSNLMSEEEKKKYKWICDTHDVQYVRNESASSQQRRFLSFSKYDKKLEQKTLASFDAIMAISSSDAEELRKLFKDKVLEVASSFQYAAEKITQRDEKKPLNFGFIGGRMDANLRAVKFILQEWWPLIRAFSPSSKLYIAGSVSRLDEIKEDITFDDSVVDMGFVDDLSNFYKKIDVSLNPVLVQGGLNFKSIEAVVAGKLLLTNYMGSKCLGSSDISTIISKPKDLEKTLLDFEVNNDEAYELILKRQESALEHFGDEGAYASLREYFNEK